MAKEWYLLDGPHNTVSGFESDALFDFGADSFLELLETDIADTVELCNYDLSECAEAKAIIQNNLQDTKLKTLTRLMLVPIGSCKAGMYVKYKGRYWLIVSLVDDNKVYEKAVLYICNYKVAWIDKQGVIHERWTFVESASQYNNGETNAKNYFIRSDQVMVYMPDDDYSMMLDSGVRFVIDRRCRVYEKGFDKNTVKDTSNPVVVYDITRVDSVLYSYEDSGHFEFLATQCEQHPEDGYYVVGGKGYWLCQEPSAVVTHVENAAYSEILHDTDTLFIGIDEVVFDAKFYNASGEEVQVTPVWNIIKDFDDGLDVSSEGNTIVISTSNKKLRNKSFTLSLSATGYLESSVTIYIRDFI